MIDLQQNLGRPKGRQPVGILQRVKKIGYQLNQKQGEPPEQTSDTDWQEDTDRQAVGNTSSRHLLSSLERYWQEDMRVQSKQTSAGSH